MKFTYEESKKSQIGSLKYITENYSRVHGKSPDNRFINLVDRFGNTRVKIHPPDKITNYHHLHIYDQHGNPLNRHLKVVTRNSQGAHIPYGGS